MMSRVPVIENASANVSAIGIPFNSNKAGGAAVESVAAVKAFHLPKRSTGGHGVRRSVAVTQTKETSWPHQNDL